MGGAMLRGWLDSGTVTHVDILEPYGYPRAPGLAVFTDAQALINNARTPAAVILAVKPQVMNDVCAALKSFIPRDALVLSIAAGKTIASFEQTFGTTQPIVRVMPNTPAAIGKGISAAIANKNVTAAQRTLADQLLSAVSIVEWLDDESLMDAVTALSGSGPAYIFHLIETLAASGETIGLSPELSMKLARQTVIGSAALAEADADIPAATLRENVTSPGGTTAAALEVLMNGELQKIYNKALAAAVKRGKELA
ncbi:MAG: pyrroline-5-carboxylate reductase [Alphaproteobacteria bacterium]|nr:pyrroline-5-carboxylate reductase [Alphaproteobacteria bacterium]